MMIGAYIGLGLVALFNTLCAGIAASLVFEEYKQYAANWNVIWIVSMFGVIAQSIAIGCAFIAGVLS